MAQLSIRSTTATSIHLCAACSSECAMCSAAVAMTSCRSIYTRIGSRPPALATSRLWTDLLSVSMAALGHKQTFAPQTSMSALAPKKTDMCGARGYVRFGPLADSCSAAEGIDRGHSTPKELGLIKTH